MVRFPFFFYPESQQKTCRKAVFEHTEQLLNTQDRKFKHINNCFEHIRQLKICYLSNIALEKSIEKSCHGKTFFLSFSHSIF